MFIIVFLASHNKSLQKKKWSGGGRAVTYNVAGQDFKPRDELCSFW